MIAAAFYMTIQAVSKISINPKSLKSDCDLTGLNAGMITIL
jgi:hypothetical protein